MERQRGIGDVIVEPTTVLTTSSQVSVDHFGLEERKAVWADAGLQPTLLMLSTLFAELDLAVSTHSRPQVEMTWSGSVPRPLRAALRVALRKGQSILTVSTMLQCVKEVIEFASEDSRDRIGQLDFALCVLGINTDIAAASEAGADGDTIDSAGVMGRVAQHSLDYPHTFETLASEVSQNWLQPWPTTTGPKVLRSIGKEPQEIFAKSTGVTFIEFLTIGWALYNMVRHEKKVQFGEGNLVVMNLSDEVIEAFMDRCVWQLSDLRNRLLAERNEGSGTPWTRYYLQMRPFIQLPSGSFLLVRPQYLVQRFMGEPLFVDVNEELKGSSSTQSNHFRSAVNHKFEKKVGAVLDRISKHCGDRVISEDEMIARFRITKKSNESICDFAYVAGDVCVLIDANNRHLMQGFAEGTGAFEEFESEIRDRFSSKKFMQLKRTIEQFQEFGWNSGDAIIDSATVFVPLVVGPEDGIPSNSLTERLIMDGSAGMFQDFGDKARPATIINVRDLRILEGLTEKRGLNFAQLILEWRDYCVAHPDYQCSLDLFEQHKGYDGPLSEYDHKLGFDFFEDMRETASEIYIQRLPTDMQSEARRVYGQAKQNLPTRHM
ncbi:hypothetical protein ACWEVD_01465 [Nocardia thailandica]